MADSTGYKFIYFSAIFYLFLGVLLTFGAGTWLTSSITSNNTFSAGDYNATATTQTSSWDIVSFIFQNPFSGLSWLAWLSVAMLITNIYIIVTSLIP